MFIGLIAIQAIEGIQRQAQRFGEGAQQGDPNLGHFRCQVSNVGLSEGNASGKIRPLRKRCQRRAFAKLQGRALGADIELLAPVGLTAVNSEAARL